MLIFGQYFDTFIINDNFLHFYQAGIKICICMYMYIVLNIINSTVFNRKDTKPQLTIKTIKKLKYSFHPRVSALVEETQPSPDTTDAVC